jgi:hypothetical protein
MTSETTKKPPAEISYSWPEQKVTIRDQDGGVIVLRIQDAMWLGSQLYNLLNPIEQPCHMVRYRGVMDSH